MDFGDRVDPDLDLIAEAVGGVCRVRRRLLVGVRQEHRFPWEFYERMAEGGWVGIAIPEEYGGGGRGITEAATVLRTVAASGAAMNGCSAIHLTIFGLNPVVVFGNDRLKETFLPRAAAGDLHVAFGVTEPDAGTDTSRITTRATRDGDGWRISGRKIWTSKALESEVVLLLVRTGEADTGLRRAQPVPRRPRPGPRRHPADPEGRPQRRGVVRGVLRRPAGGGLAAGGRGGQGASATCSTGSTPSGSCWPARPSGSARRRCAGR
jgi:alkylation response protein AidB-like acyl-CoA dehydrogenase